MNPLWAINEPLCSAQISHVDIQIFFFILRSVVKNEWWMEKKCARERIALALTLCLNVF